MCQIADIVHHIVTNVATVRQINGSTVLRPAGKVFLYQCRETIDWINVAQSWIKGKNTKAKQSYFKVSKKITVEPKKPYVPHCIVILQRKKKEKEEKKRKYQI